MCVTRYYGISVHERIRSRSFPPLHREAQAVMGDPPRSREIGVPLPSPGPSPLLLAPTPERPTVIRSECIASVNALGAACVARQYERENKKKER